MNPIRPVAAAFVIAAVSTAQTEPLCDVQVAYLTAPEPAWDGAFGTALLLDGDELLVGCQAGVGPSTAPGGVFVLEDGPGGFAIVQTLSLLDGEAGGFGFSLASDCNRLVVGSPAQLGWGAAIVHRRVGGEWSRIATLREVPSGIHNFGARVALDGAYVFVTGRDQPHPFVPGSEYGPGRVYVYEDTPSWPLVQVLEAEALGANDDFGLDLEAGGGRLVVGASDALYVFVDGVGGWEVDAVLPSPDVAYSQFGRALALEGDRLAAGQSKAGEVVLYSSASGAWELDAIVVSGALDHHDDFGASVALDGDRLAVGAPRWEDDEEEEWGALAVFDHDGTEWVERAFVRANAPADDGDYGASAVLDGDRLLVGSPSAHIQDAGAVYEVTLGPPAALCGDVSALAALGNGMQRFELRAGSVHADDLYYVLGSINGSAPGFQLDGIPIPLNPDLYFFMTLTGAGPLYQGAGVLDADGFADGWFALFLVPPLPALVGTTVHHAAVVLDEATGAPVFASNAIALDLE